VARLGRGSHRSRADRGFSSGNAGQGGITSARERGDSAVKHALALIAIVPIRLYQRLLSPLFPPSCRFTPTCSNYAVTALERHGLLKGGWLAIRRIGRCHPWNPGGHDPVP